MLKTRESADYEIIECIGEGAYASVYKAKRHADNEVPP